MAAFDGQWVLEVLTDLQGFAHEYRLTASARALTATSEIVRQELRSLGAPSAIAPTEFLDALAMKSRPFPPLRLITKDGERVS